MKKILAWVLALALIAVASVIATLAYFMDVDSEENIFTIGNIDIELLEYERVDTETADDGAEVQEFHDNKPLIPAVIANGFGYTPGGTYVDWDSELNNIKPNTGYTSPIWDPAKINNEVDKMVFVKNTGNYSTYVRTYFAFEAGNFDTFDKFEKNIHINLNDNEDEWVWEWVPFLAEIDGEKYFIAKATYQKALEAGKLTEISLSQIALDSRADNEDAETFGEEYRVLVSTQGIQAAGFEKPETALDEGFGTDIPFDGVTLEAGIDLKIALHNLNGDTTKPITAKVESVIFGLNEDHSEIVDNYHATLTSAGQDVPVYTYYVPSTADAAKYDIFVLADSAIYTPKDSTDLFRGMTSLTNVDTANMDVSRTEIMSNMFRGCTQLTSLDVSSWDVSNATKMNSVFESCSNIDNLNVSQWEVDNVKDMSWMFYGCGNITDLNVSNWKVNNVETFQRTFSGCKRFRLPSALKNGSPPVLKICFGCSVSAQTLSSWI
jgi:predicted ribosomally synthesized peptide with SipW-like signal peptide